MWIDDLYWQARPAPNNRCRAHSNQRSLDRCIEVDMIKLSGQILSQIQETCIDRIILYLRKPPPSREALSSISQSSIIPTLAIPPTTPHAHTHHHPLLLSSALRHSISRSRSHTRSDLAELPFTANCSCVCGVLYQSSSAECFCPP